MKIKTQESVDDFIKFIEVMVNDEWLWGQYFKDWVPHDLALNQKEFDELRQYFFERIKGRFIFVHKSTTDAFT